MTRRSLVLAASVSLAASSAVRAQDSSAFSGADRETGAALTRIVRAASARGLPVDPIVSKVRFAIVVHAPASQIVATARAVAERLEAARTALAPDTLSADIAAGEAALSYDVPADVLVRIRKAAGGRAIAVPLGVLTQLVVSRVPAARAGDIVTELMRRGATPAQLVSLGNDVNADVQRGARALESAEIRFRGLTPHLAPGEASTAAAAPTGASSGPKKP